MSTRQTKTTLYLPDLLRTRLKTVAARRRTTVSALLAEGADLIVARYEGAADRAELAARAAAARKRLRAGLYRGPGIARMADELAYGKATKRIRRLRRARRRATGK
jgi:hypothetical protein